MTRLVLPGQLERRPEQLVGYTGVIRIAAKIDVG